MLDETGCPLCEGACASADLTPFHSGELRWLWVAIAAAADRRGDPHLVDGPAVKVRAPASAAERAAAVGLLGGRISAGQLRAVALPQLTGRIRRRGAGLTPGAVAAHVVGRRLAERAREKAERAATLQALADHLRQRMISSSPETEIDVVTTVEAVRRTGALARLLREPDPRTVIDAAVRVVAAIPEHGSRTDRRLLAERTLRDPHGLDEREPVERMARAIIVAAGLAPASTRARHVWSAVGVDWDELTGGITTLGIHLDGWHLPSTAVVTIPPIELTGCRWAAPSFHGSWVFVTENPSVLTAARALALAGGSPRIICTSGTPSTLETTAIARLTNAGWNLAVRADFDAAGLRHVQALIQAAPRAVPWRMSTDDYLAAIDTDGHSAQADSNAIASPWDPELALTMQRIGSWAYEEASISTLLDDLTRGAPNSDSSDP